MVGMVGLIKDVNYVIPSFVQTAGDLVYLVGQTGDDYAGSELQKLLTGKISGALADLDLAEINAYLKKLLQAMETGLVKSSHDLSEGGLGVALAETAFKTDLGLDLNLTLTKAQLFSETAGRLVVTVAKEKQAAFEELLGQAASLVGQVTAEHKLVAKLSDGQLQLDLAEGQKIWEEAIPCLMKSKA